jgi:hypothetical protein
MGRAPTIHGSVDFDDSEMVLESSKTDETFRAQNPQPAEEWPETGSIEQLSTEN